MQKFEKEEFKNRIRENVKLLFRTKIEHATKQQIFQALAYTVKDSIIDDWIDTHRAYEEQDVKILYYMSMEFLMGRALGNMLLNISEDQNVREALSELGIDLNEIEDQVNQADPGKSAPKSDETPKAE